MDADEFSEWEAALAARGFNKIEDTEDPLAFGNRLVVMVRPDLRLRYVRDRGQGGVEVASPVAPDEWFDAAVVMEMFGRLSSKEPTTLELQMLHLLERMDDVATAFRKQNLKSTRRRLKAIEVERMRTLFDGLLRRE